MEQISQERGYGRRSGRRKELEDELLLHYHFGGLSVFYRVTPDDLIVLAAGRLGTEEFCRVTEALGADERRDALFDSVNPWDDDVSQLLGPESDAG